MSGRGLVKANSGHNARVDRRSVLLAGVVVVGYLLDLTKAGGLDGSRSGAWMDRREVLWMADADCAGECK